MHSKVGFQPDCSACRVIALPTTCTCGALSAPSLHPLSSVPRQNQKVFGLRSVCYFELKLQNTRHSSRSCDTASGSKKFIIHSISLQKFSSKFQTLHTPPPRLMLIIISLFQVALGGENPSAVACGWCFFLNFFCDPVRFYIYR